jgi:hypothetical protein
MKEKPETIKIDDQEYIRADAVGKPAQSLNGMPYRIVRTYSAGVFAGYQDSRTGQEVVLRNARRLWQWAGAASLSQLATDGTSKPDDCKFPCAVDRVELLQVIEILDCSEKSRKSIEGVSVWQC